MVTTPYVPSDGLIESQIEDSRDLIKREQRCKGPYWYQHRTAVFGSLWCYGVLGTFVTLNFNWRQFPRLPFVTTAAFLGGVGLFTAPLMRNMFGDGWEDTRIRMAEDAIDAYGYALAAEDDTGRRGRAKVAREKLNRAELFKLGDTPGNQGRV